MKKDCAGTYGIPDNGLGQLVGQPGCRYACPEFLQENRRGTLYLPYPLLNLNWTFSEISGIGTGLGAGYVRSMHFRNLTSRKAQPVTGFDVRFELLNASSGLRYHV